MNKTIYLRGAYQKMMAKGFIDDAPINSIVEIRPEKRSDPQNRKMWAMLNDVMLAEPEGRQYTREAWKAIFMNALGHEIAFIEGLNGEPFPLGFSSSNLNKSQMADLIEYIYAYGSQHNVKWSEQFYGYY